jgi:hypothetical protein
MKHGSKHFISSNLFNSAHSPSQGGGTYYPPFMVEVTKLKLKQAKGWGVPQVGRKLGRPEGSEAGM